MALSDLNKAALAKELMKKDRKIEEKNKKNPVSDMESEGSPVAERRSGKERRKS